jgi:hypothetical protein
MKQLHNQKCLYFHIPQTTIVQMYSKALSQIGKRIAKISSKRSVASCSQTTRNGLTDPRKKKSLPSQKNKKIVFKSGQVCF